MVSIIGSSSNWWVMKIHEINALIMPKKLSEGHNNKLWRENGYGGKKENVHKKDFKRVKNGYIYLFGRFMGLVKVKNFKQRKLHMTVFQKIARKKIFF